MLSVGCNLAVYSVDILLVNLKLGCCLVLLLRTVFVMHFVLGPPPADGGGRKNEKRLYRVGLYVLFVCLSVSVCLSFCLLSVFLSVCLSV